MTTRSNLATLIAKHPRLVLLLHEHGINFCAGCYLTLSSDPERAAAYHGVPDVARFLRELDRVVAPKPRRRHSRRR